MPASNYLLSFWDEQRQVFLQNLALVRQRPSKTAVHAIRVSIKKLKSILQFINTIRPEEDELAFDTIQFFFLTSGKFRDVDMSLSLMRKTGRQEKIDLPGFRKTLGSMLSITRTSTKVAAAGPLEEELVSVTGQLQSRLEGLTDDRLDQFVQELAYKILDEVKELLEQLPEQAHLLRKKLKRLNYWLRSCPINTCFDEPQMKQLDKSLRSLGYWHDFLVFHQKLRKFRKEYLVKGSVEDEHTRKMEDIAVLLRDQWLSDARQRVKKLL